MKYVSYSLMYQFMFFSTCHMDTVCIMHSALPPCPQPLLVRSLQLVEVWLYSEERKKESLYHPAI